MVFSIAHSPASLREGQAGSVMVESSIAILMILSIIFTTFDCFRFGYTVLASEWILSRHARSMVIGGEADGVERAQRIKEEIHNYARKIGLELDSRRNPQATVTICSDGPNCSEDANAGLGGAFVTIRITNTVRFLFGAIEYPYQSVIFVRNEPF